MKGIDGATVLFLSDEHATIALPPTARSPSGDRIELWPSHIDPTINLHDVMYACDGDDVVEVWPIAARGYPEATRALGAAACPWPSEPAETAMLDSRC